MSMFRKPKKIQRRVFCADDDDDGDPEPPPPPIISNQTKKEKPTKVTTLLSFADEEEEDGEVFKVKKSSQSKRLAKRREKEKKRIPDGDNDKFDNDNHNNEEKEPDETEKTKPKKKVTLEGLILSGREALAADGTGDVSDESGNEEDSRGFHKYRAESVRAALAVAPGHIPDAALIHAARKTRQQARELGDFVPLQSEAPPGSRLIRDDDGDDDEEEGRIVVRGLELPSDKPKRGTKAALSDEEINSEAEEWEEQQMQKAVPSIVDITGEGIELNPFAVAPPPPRLSDAPAHLRPLAAPGAPPPASAHELLQALQARLSELNTDREATAEKLSVCREKLLCAARTRESRAARTAQLDAAYRRAQAARGYVTDLVECLDEKMPQLEALEARALALHRRRCEFLVERRRADVRDQAQDVLALAARPGAAKPVDSEEKRQRTAEREGRRRARRLRREAAGTAHAHRDGDSSDDDLPPALLHHCAQETEAIRSLSARLFADALGAWRSVRGVCAGVTRLRRRQPALYADAYVAHCLPRLLAPYVRHQASAPRTHTHTHTHSTSHGCGAASPRSTPTRTSRTACRACWRPTSDTRRVLHAHTHTHTHSTSHGCGAASPRSTPTRTSRTACRACWRPTSDTRRVLHAHTHTHTHSTSHGCGAASPRSTPTRTSRTACRACWRPTSDTRRVLHAHTHTHTHSTSHGCGAASPRSTPTRTSRTTCRACWRPTSDTRRVLHAHTHTHTHTAHHTAAAPPARALRRRVRRALPAAPAGALRPTPGECSMHTHTHTHTQHITRLRRRQPALYADAYVAHCLPRLLAPYVRHQLILWNPLADEDNEDYEKMDWYKCLMMYGVKSEALSSDSDQSSDDETEPPEVTEDSVRDDPDLMLVPTIIEKVVLPKVTELVEQAWDPLSVRACVRLRRVLLRAAALPGASAAPRRLAAAVRARLAAALAADVFLPALPPQIMEGAGGAFWRRSLGGGVRLLRAVLALCAPPAVLRADSLALALIETLSCAAGAAPGPQTAAAAAALAATLPRSGALRAAALRRLAALAQLALARLHSDNPMHLKALEQARGVLAEAKAVE
ncbi:unnamed protein product [Euphydryas editha]|uniref:GCF C-terminal domain-containing protein n=1 Tax=Euphydryas editha TaxID=104508 RepID=A0AAU9UJG6_EUPED|nr:unnamed protein product [Euphydryas editha]